MHQTNVTQVSQRGLAAWRGQTLALGPRLLHTALCANPQSVAQSDLSGNGVVHTAQLNEVARSEIEDLFPTVRTLVRLTWTPLPSYATAILRPIVRGSGWGCGVYSQHTFNELQLLLVHLKTSIGSLLLYLRPCSVLIILYEREVFIASSCVENLILLPADRYEEYKCLISSDGGNELAPSQSVYHWQGGKWGQFTILSTWGHVIALPSSAVRSRFIIKPLQLWSTINSPDWPRVTKCTTNNLGTNILVFCQ